ncbi:MAG: hypothetical protein MUP27_09205 [Desulfobacterales bacterium]|nr:hypothetical protein [Desulfobacterales bacterium]
METIRFKSLTRNGVAYEVNPNRGFEFNRDPHNYIHEKIKEYLTYGDGLTIHSPPTIVLKDYIVDFLASLGSYILNNPIHFLVNGMEILESIWTHNLYNKDIDFALSIKFNPEKKQFYSFQEKKISSSKSKQYDKRWEEIKEWNDGSLNAGLNLLQKSFWNCLETFSAYEDIRNRFSDMQDWSGGHIDGYGIGYTGEYTDLEYGFKVIDRLVKAYREIDQAKRTFECLDNNWIKKQSKEKVA